MENSEGEDKEKGTESQLMIMTKNFPNLKRQMDIQIQEIYNTSIG